uniref:Uncharacterized protein n=1 Tax=Arundo donax TaxID=35708 RepID=A0A0A9C9S2_ARUDO
MRGRRRRWRSLRRGR